MRKALEGEGDSVRGSEGVFDITHHCQTREIKLIDDQKPCREHTLIHIVKIWGNKITWFIDISVSMKIT